MPRTGSGCASIPPSTTGTRGVGGSSTGSRSPTRRSAVKPIVHRIMTESARTLVILDEVHHGGDALTWGDAHPRGVRAGRRGACRSPAPRSAATRRRSRSSSTRRTSTGIRISRTDYTYGYGRALADGVVRPVIFMSYAGKMRWRTKMGDELRPASAQPDTKDVTAQAWRTALSPDGEWMPAVLRAAEPPAHGGARRHPGCRRPPDRDRPDRRARLRVAARADHRREARRGALGREGELAAHRAVHPLRPALDGRRAHGVGGRRRAAARGRRLRDECRDAAVLRAGRRPVRAGAAPRRDRDDLPAERADPHRARECTRARARPRARPRARRRRSCSTDARCRSSARSRRATGCSTSTSGPRSSPRREFDHALYDGHAFGTTAMPGTEEELDFIGLPGILEPDQVRDLLRQRQARQAERTRGRPPQAEGTRAGAAVPHTRRAAAAAELARRHAREDLGEPHGHIHAELRRICGGPRSRERRCSSCRRGSSTLRRGIGHCASGSSHRWLALRIVAAFLRLCGTLRRHESSRRRLAATLFARTSTDGLGLLRESP